MARTPKPWFREDRGEWYVTIRGERHRLGADKAEAERQFHELMAKKPEAPRKPKTSGLTVAGLFEKFLDWCSRHRSPRTYADYKDYLQSFLDETPGLSGQAAEAIKPFHVIEWVDKHPTWGNTIRRRAMISVQRAYNWAEELGYTAASPVRKLKKPPCGRREQAVTPEQWQQVKARYPEGDHFLDLLEFCWETGCRPYEARTIEPRHLHLDRHCVLFPPDEAKGKKRWRIIRLTPRAAEILKRRAGGRGEGMVFLNAKGRPWTAFAMNCCFCRLKKHVGMKHFAYAWRHGFATRKLLEGHDHLTVAELLGHSDGTMLAKVYQHLDQNDEHLRKALASDA